MPVGLRNGFSAPFANAFDIFGEDAQRLKHALECEIADQGEGDGQSAVHQNEGQEDFTPHPEQFGYVDLGKDAAGREAFGSQGSAWPGSACGTIDNERLVCREAQLQLKRKITFNGEPGRVR